MQPDQILEFGKQRLYFFRSRCALANAGVFDRSLARGR